MEKYFLETYVLERMKASLRNSYSLRQHSLVLKVYLIIFGGHCGSLSLAAFSPLGHLFFLIVTVLGTTLPWPEELVGFEALTAKVVLFDAFLVWFTLALTPEVLFEAVLAFLEGGFSNGAGGALVDAFWVWVVLALLADTLDAFLVLSDFLVSGGSLTTSSISCYSSLVIP